MCGELYNGQVPIGPASIVRVVTQILRKDLQGQLILR
jgi:hypothetical protein